MEEIHHLMGEQFFAPENIPLKVIRRNPQPPYPLHTHDFMEMVIILGGKGCHYGSKGDISISRGAVFVIKGDMIHGYRNLDQLKLINVLFDIGRLAIPLSDLGLSPGFHSIFTVEPSTRFSDLNQLMFHLDNNRLKILTDQVSLLEECLNSKEPGSQFMGISHFMQIMHYVSREFDAQHQSSRQTIPYRLGQTLSYLESRLTETPSISKLTEMAGMSESSLLRAFKKITGVSPLKYHQQLRIKKAIWYLRYSQYSMMEISQLLGYNDSNYFARQFRTLTGKSPSGYRKTLVPPASGEQNDD